MKKILFMLLLVLILFSNVNSQELYLGLPVISWEEIGNSAYIILSEDDEAGIIIIEFEGEAYVLRK